MSLGPVVAGAALSEHKVVRAEDLSEGPGADAVHGAGLQVHQDRPRDVLPAARLVVVHIDPLQLEVRVPVVSAGGVNSVLIGDDLPELKNKRLNVVGLLFACFGSGFNRLNESGSRKANMAPKARLTNKI